jgi:hypothetical protein
MMSSSSETAPSLAGGAATGPVCATAAAEKADHTDSAAKPRRPAKK